MTSQLQKYIFGAGSVEIRQRKPDGTPGKRLAGISAILRAAYEDEVEIVQAEAAGAARYSQDAQYGAGTAKLTLEFNKLPLGLFEALKGRDVTLETADASGDVSSAFTNAVGTSIGDNITAVALTASSEKDVPLGRITLKVLTTTTVDVYTEKSDVPVLAAVTIATGANVLAGLGITLTGDAAIALTPGDEAYVTGRPADAQRTSIALTGNEIPKELTIAVHAQELVQGELMRFEVAKAICASLPMELVAKEHAKFSLEFTVLQPPGGQTMYSMTTLQRA